jgi:hypothetical protein
MSSQASKQFVYTMHRVTKRVPPDKTVFNDLTLAFYSGARSACSATTARASRRS